MADQTKKSASSKAASKPAAKTMKPAKGAQASAKTAMKSKAKPAAKPATKAASKPAPAKAPVSAKAPASKVAPAKNQSSPSMTKAASLGAAASKLSPKPAPKAAVAAPKVEPAVSVPSPAAAASVAQPAPQTQAAAEAASVPAAVIPVPVVNAVFEVGDNAVYPGHGVGVVRAIESKEIFGKKHEFYSIQILENGMKIMIPKDNVASVGLRPIISRDEAAKVISILRETNVKIDNQTWNRRYREYMEKIKTGSVFEIAEVLRDLFLLKVDKELSFGERKMLDTARGLLLKELSLATSREELQGQDEVAAIFGLMDAKAGT